MMLKVPIAHVLVSLLVLHLAADSSETVATTFAANLPPQPKIACDGACAVRCSNSSRPNLCHRACGTCCSRCNCVPPDSRCNCVPPDTFNNCDVCFLL